MPSVSLVQLSANPEKDFSFYTNGAAVGFSGPSLQRVHPCKCSQVENNGTAHTSNSNFVQVMLRGRKVFRIQPIDRFCGTKSPWQIKE